MSSNISGVHIAPGIQILLIYNFVLHFCTLFCEHADFYLVANPKWSKMNPKVNGSGSEFARIRVKAGFGSGKIP
jgi:hypothetical protein